MNTKIEESFVPRAAAGAAAGGLRQEEYLKVLREKQADILHMHGYGATTFGRLCAWRLGIPAILHVHANHGDTPWFQKVADRLLAPHTDMAIAVSESTAEFTIRARLMPAQRTKVVYLGAPLDEFARERSAGEVAAARRALGIEPGTLAIGTIPRLMPAKGNRHLVEAAPQFAVSQCLSWSRSSCVGPRRVRRCPASSRLTPC